MSSSRLYRTDSDDVEAGHQAVDPDFSYWPPGACLPRAVAVLLAMAAAILLAGGGMLHSCGGGVVRPWCSTKYQLSFKRPGQQWGAPVVTSEFSDLPRAGNSCNQLLGLPRIALLFLSRGRMYHEDAWTEWFAAVRGLLPKQALQRYGGGCAKEDVHRIQQACTVDAAAPLLEQQFLFNVYNHPAPDFEGYPEGNVFHSHVLPQRIPTNWGSANLTIATRLMFRHALRDPHAQWFLALSDTGLPLYPATTVYLQLMSEQRSRINACAAGVGTGRNPSMWNWQQPLHDEGRIDKENFRKHTQWVGLRRKHAESVTRDEKVFSAFKEHCRSWMDKKGDVKHHKCKAGRTQAEYHQCKVDEHYFSTLLAIEGRDLETDCKGNLVTSNWTVPGRHSGGPYEYFPKDVTAELFERLRTDVDWGVRSDPDTCMAAAAINLGQRGFLAVANINSTSCRDNFGGSWAALTQECPLFARKFPADTAEVVLETWRNTTNGLAII